MKLYIRRVPDNADCKRCKTPVWRGGGPKFSETILCPACGADNSVNPDLRWRIKWAWRRFRYPKTAFPKAGLYGWNKVRWYFRWERPAPPAAPPVVQTPCDCEMCRKAMEMPIAQEGEETNVVSTL